MSLNTLLPRPVALLRSCIVAANYRSYLTKMKTFPDLDRLANESYSGSNSQMLHKAQTDFFSAFENHNGSLWADQVQRIWNEWILIIQTTVKRVNTLCLENDTAISSMEKVLIAPALHQSLITLTKNISGPDIEQWWSSPFDAWIDYSCSKYSVERNSLLESLTIIWEIDPKTLSRWVEGKSPIEAITPPYAPLLSKALEIILKEQPPTDSIQHISGWLSVAVACHSLPDSLRSNLQELASIESNDWNIDHATQQLVKLGYDRLNTGAANDADHQIKRLENLVAGGLPPTHLQVLLTKLENEPEAPEHGFAITDNLTKARIKGWLAILENDDEKAIRIFDYAIQQSWWCAGPLIGPILQDALLHAVGIAYETRTKGLIDRLKLLGEIKQQSEAEGRANRRLMCMAFERRFPPRQSKEKVPPQFEFLDLTSKSKLTSRQLKNPNRLSKFAHGKTRRTLLMQAVLTGNLANMDELLRAGANPNEYVVESGESALSIALRRAGQNSDSAPLDCLLRLDLSSETVNRPSSTAQETPLALGIELDSGIVVERLIQLGATTKTASDLKPPYLNQVLYRLHNANLGLLHPNFLQPWLAGEDPSSIDAKHNGTFLKEDVSSTRQSSFQAALNDPRKKSIMENVAKHMQPNNEGCLAVLGTLLKNKADPNQTYRAYSHPSYDWTPTLYAAEVGNLQAFKMMIEYGGDPNRRLKQHFEAQPMDALYIAVTYGNDAIVKWIGNVK